MTSRFVRRNLLDQMPRETRNELILLRDGDTRQNPAVASNLVLLTNHCKIAVRQTAGQKLPILLLHGGGLCKEIFARQLESSLGNQHRMIAIDWPGHGESGDAFDPERTYSVEGLADLALEVLERLDIDTAVVVGVSLGGRVALEMIQTFPGLIGVGITGVPIASSRTRFQADLAEFGLLGASAAVHKRVDTFLRRSFGDIDAESFRSAITRTDRRCLELITAELRSTSERWPTAESIAKTPVLAIGGSIGPLTSTGREPGGRRAQSRFSIVQSGPAPYLQVPEIYNNILGRFMSRMTKRERQLSITPDTWYGG